MQHTKFLVIGGGVSGLSAARMLHEKTQDYILLEKSDRVGGLIKCDVVEGHLFHPVGGHIFNTKIPEIASWFWEKFNRENEFLEAKRKAGILLENLLLGYPVENYLYMLPEHHIRSIFDELVTLSATGKKDPLSYESFETFLRGNFGETLYNLYFKPFNEKIWKTDLSKVALPWLEGKLPMPDYREIILSNILRKEEKEMVHSRFYYPRKNGSQFIANRISEGLRIITSTEVFSIERKDSSWLVNSEYSAENIIYTGDLRKLGNIIKSPSREIGNSLQKMHSLQSHGTSTLLCQSDESPYSWLYIPDKEIPAHRIIFTGNFSPENNPPQGRRSCTVEFSGEVSLSTMKSTLKKLPFNLRAIASNYEPNSYVIQQIGDRERIADLKQKLSEAGIFLVGRFAEWEYFNMDKAMESAMKVVNSLTLD